jgi:hypothetical protein
VCIAREWESLMVKPISCSGDARHASTAQLTVTSTDMDTSNRDALEVDFDWRHPMKNVSRAALFAIVAAFAATPVLAQQRASMPGQVPHTLNPSMSLSRPATSPLAQQKQDDYATQLMATQRQLLQQNPSGMSRQELAIGHALNGFAPR